MEEKSFEFYSASWNVPIERLDAIEEFVFKIVEALPFSDKETEEEAAVNLKNMNETIIACCKTPFEILYAGFVLGTIGSFDDDDSNFEARELN